MSTNTQRIAIFFLAVILQVVSSLVQGIGFSFDSATMFWLLTSGVEALLIFELMYRTQNWLRLITLPIYAVIFFVIEVFLDTVVGGYIYGYSVFDSLWTNLSLSFQYSISNPGYIITSLIILIVAYILVGGPGISLPGVSRHGGSSGSDDKLVLEISDDFVTRLLCSSAVTNGSNFRRKVLSRVENQYMAVAPEFGLDLDLVSRVSQFFERRETKFQIAFLAAGMASLILSFSSPLFFLFLIVFTAPIMFVKMYNEKFDYLKDFTTRSYDREKVRNRYANLKASLTPGLPQPGQNLIIYNGFLPFIGAGFDLGGWSFALDISRPKNDFGQIRDVSEFEINQLYKQIDDACAKLNIPSLHIDNFCFVNGMDIRNDKIILPNPIGRPVQCIDDDYLKKANDFRIRQYKHISVSAWGNDIIFSIFLRCTKKGKNLFVEAARYLLPPVDGQYRKLDHVPNKSFSSVFGILLSALILGPIQGIIAVFVLLGKFFSYLSHAFGFHDRRIRNEIQRNFNFNYGVTTSFRQDVMGKTYLHYFQRADREMFVKILDNEILETLITFLNDHNIDTSQLRERQNTIMNNGIVVQGGNIESQSIAVGRGAKSVTQTKAE